jgi:hypothetical protein
MPQILQHGNSPHTRLLSAPLGFSPYVALGEGADIAYPSSLPPLCLPMSLSRPRGDPWESVSLALPEQTAQRTQTPASESRKARKTPSHRAPPRRVWGR